MTVRFTENDLKIKGYQVKGGKAVKPDDEKKENKIHAVSQVIDGIRFSSKLELYQYNLLNACKIPFEFQVEYELLPSFVYLGKKIQNVSIIVDFYLKEHDLIVDTKGLNMIHTKIKIKMLKHKLFQEGKATRIELPSTKIECEKLINEILAVNNKIT